MSKLGGLLKDRIGRSGPISLHDFMKEALGHPEFGYYCSKEPFGETGDFITAPEISQIFGELIGLWCVDCWMKMGSPASFNLVEFGPGTGTLMTDALRSAALVPEFLSGADIHLVENSQRLREMQKRSLATRGVVASWHDSFPDLPPKPTLFLANEFFDALPIHQYICEKGQWYERQVDWQEEAFQFCQAAQPTELDGNYQAKEDGTIAEICPAATDFMTAICQTLETHGGAALIIDYGAMGAVIGDSFQALRGHKSIDPLQNPGDADLTAHVKFRQLTDIAERHDLTIQGPTSQGRFLERLGIEARSEMLARKANDEQRQTLKAGLKRLTSTEEMGTLFKVLAVSHNMAAPAEGFGRDDAAK
ncbi:MAG: SAM-dependent methyltransferase [Proteobacteria bacterium]|nr:SAM-dependent methyltransferase [Pseudomonadota bacterium]